MVSNTRSLLTPYWSLRIPCPVSWDTEDPCVLRARGGAGEAGAAESVRWPESLGPCDPESKVFIMGVCRDQMGSLLQGY